LNFRVEGRDGRPLIAQNAFWMGRAADFYLDNDNLTCSYVVVAADSFVVP